MTIRTSKIVALILVGATLAVTPALAQAVTAGNQGPAEIPATRDAPLSLPGNVAPLPTPKVDSATARDFLGMDPAQALDSLGTLTLDRSGDVTEVEASEAVRAAFEAQVKGHTGN